MIFVISLMKHAGLPALNSMRFSRGLNQATGSQCQLSDPVQGKFVSICLESGGLFMSPSFRMPFMCFTHFRKKREERAKRTLIWLVNVTNKSEDKL